MDGSLRRRTVLGSVGTGLGLALAGCLGNGDDEDDGASPEPPDAVDDESAPQLPQVEDPPEAVYMPTHREAMVHPPTVEAGDYAISPMLTYPHRFWLVTGAETEEVVPEAPGAHVMMTLWDRETGAVLPVDAGTEMRISKDGDVIDQRAPWPMISQTMGFHFGDNVPLPEDGTYTVEIDINPITTRKTGAFEGRFDERETATFEFDYDESFRRHVLDGVEYLDEEYWGQPGALEPMGHGDGHDDGHDDHGSNDDHHDGHDDHGSHDGHDDHGDADHPPFSALPPAADYPGRALGEPESGDATFVIRYLDDSRFTDGGDGYLLVSPRTPYNRVPLADMALSIEGPRDADLVQTLDSEVGLHYGVAIDLSPGDSVDVVVDAPPQVSRHAGYETAFLEMPSMTVEVPEDGT